MKSDRSTEDERDQTESKHSISSDIIVMIVSGMITSLISLVTMFLTQLPSDQPTSGRPYSSADSSAWVRRSIPGRGAEIRGMYPIRTPDYSEPSQQINLGWGRVRHTTFDSLVVDVPAFFSVYIFPYSDSLAAIYTRSIVDERDDTYSETDSVRIGSVMRVELAGSDFDIMPTGSTLDQPLTQIEPTVWAWMIEPQELGDRELILTLSVVADVDGIRLPRVLRVLRQPIRVVGVVPIKSPPSSFRLDETSQAFSDQRWDTITSVEAGSIARHFDGKKRSLDPLHDTAFAIQDGIPETPNFGRDDPREVAMSSGVVIGVTFLGVLLLFLMVAYYHPPNSPYAYSILKLISAICGGFAGGFLTGEAVVKISNDAAAGGLQYALSGTAGFGLFLVIWMFFPPPPAVEPAPAQVGEDGFNYTPPEGCTFEQAAKLIAKSRKAVVRLQGFTEVEYRAVLDSQEIHANDAAHALKLLRDLAPRGQVRNYEVKYSDSVYTMTVR